MLDSTGSSSIKYDSNKFDNYSESNNDFVSTSSISSLHSEQTFIVNDNSTEPISFNVDIENEEAIERKKRLNLLINNLY